MFTGIIQQLGTIEKIEDFPNLKRLTIQASFLADEQKIGSSICVDGVCLTVIDKTAFVGKFGATFTVEVIEETLQKTIAGNYKVGAKVNLEPALKLGDGLDGHLVSGHVDAKGKVIERRELARKIGLNQSEVAKKTEGETSILRISLPLDLLKYIAMKGSITVNGVSLTISKLHEDGFEVSLIPHTQKTTNLGFLKAEDEVNLEIDLVARYLERLLSQKDREITYKFLQERGFV